jgi:hypothetical protein
MNTSVVASSPYVALIVDAAGHYAFVVTKAKDWDEAIDQLENIGCEVVEDQTDEYEADDLENLMTSKEFRIEYGVCSLSELIVNRNFIPN